MVDDTNLQIVNGMIDDFESLIDNDVGVTVTYTPVTTIQYGADGTEREEGTSESRVGIIYISTERYENLPEGFFEDTDAVMLAKKGDTYVRDGKIEYGGNTYRIKNVGDMLWHPGSGTRFGTKLYLVKV